MAPQSGPGTVHFEMEGRIAHIVLDRPPLNVIDIAMMRRMANCLEEAGRQRAAIVLWRGAGDRAFSAGVEIRQHTPDLVSSMLENFHAVFHQMDEMEAVQIAAIHGFCMGGGMELASFCDLALCTEDAIFSQPEIDVGCFPPVAATWLPFHIGAKRAAEMVLLGKKIGAAEALRLGLVNRVVSNEKLEEEAESLLKEVQSKSSAVLALTRKALRQGRAFEFASRLREVERIYLEELCATEDIKEGIEAFLERRQPNWKGA